MALATQTQPQTFWTRALLVAWQALVVVVVEPLRAAWDILPQFLVTSGSVYMVAQFGTTHSILPREVAWPMAIGFEWTWLRGVATAGKMKKSQESDLYIGLLTWTALITVVVYGVLYILGLESVGVIPKKLGIEWGVPLALAKVIPIAVMGFASANLHRIHKQQEIAAAEAAAERARQEVERDRLQAEADAERRRIQADADAAAERRRIELEQQDARELRRLREQQQIELERQYKERMIAEDVRERRRANTANTATNTAPGTQTSSTANTRANINREQRREQLRKQIVQAISADPDVNRTALAEKLGIGRTLFYDLIKEAHTHGELQIAK